MTAKQKPATALPWMIEPNMPNEIYSAVESVAATLQTEEIGSGYAERMDDNAAYIVHAANAYPKLVEALRETLRDRLTQANLHQLPLGIRARLESARALLRELGEAT